MTAEELTQTIQQVLASDDYTLGMTEDQAERIKDAIFEADRSDDDALAAYDLLHNRTVFGCAW